MYWSDLSVPPIYQLHLSTAMGIDTSCVWDGLVEVFFTRNYSANAVPSLYCGHYCNTLATSVATIIAIYRDNINSRYDTKQGSSCRDTGLISADWCS